MQQEEKLWTPKVPGNVYKSIESSIADCHYLLLTYSLQYMIREHLVDEEKARHQKKAGHGFIRKIVDVVTNFAISLTPFFLNSTGPHEGMVLRWNSQHGNIYVDGSHFRV